MSIDAWEKVKEVTYLTAEIPFVYLVFDKRKESE